MGKIDITKAPVRTGTGYPPPFDALVKARQWQKLGDLAGLTKFGVNLVTLPPGTWSSQRHWHQLEEEFVWVLEGEAVMVTDAGEETMRAGDCAGFRAGDRNGHHFQNRSAADVLFLVVGTREPGDSGEYPDIDLKFAENPKIDASVYFHKDGRPY